ncbi:NAD-dependent epimerase/dehydratase family protein [Acetobacter sp.]|uniref:NAD-dependent epimerase/dehydratase family protein n=1 Tax=Acetobacter sp. TaxID=440 RepID=UPI0039EC21AF
MTVLVTGAAGFIGFSVCERLLEAGVRIVGVDVLNSYYEPALKRARLARLQQFPHFSFHYLDIATTDMEAAIPASVRGEITEILHFAAQAGVRHSIEAPLAFADANVRGQVAMLEFARHLPALKHMVYASSSSVYGRNQALPFRESDRVDQPGSFYAVSKRSGELAAECYQHLYDLPLTGLRFFTVYGPWGRPDMAYYKFAKAIMSGEPVTLYEGNCLARDFTFITDVVDAICKIMQIPPTGKARLLNIGNNAPESVSRLVGLLEQSLNRTANIHLTARPEADVEYTWASIEKVQTLIDWSPRTDLPSGVDLFTRWFLEYETKVTAI